ncbi:MAG: hypothetical protein GY772_02210 [bacterium]|nr:hypothetical protein [bacterium]
MITRADPLPYTGDLLLGEGCVMPNDDEGGRLPGWFHRANWGGGALACLGIGLYPLLARGYTMTAVLWALFWVVMGVGAANNARLGRNSIHVPARFRRK